MGWASGTDLFDTAVSVALRHAPHINTDEGARVSDGLRRRIIKDMYEDFARLSDWDTEDESKYFKSDLVHIMYDLGVIDKDSYDWYTDPDNNF
jgi:hypothetical protein